MRVSFNLVRVIHPKTYEQWEADDTRFVIAEVKEERHGIIKYKGSLPSQAPYVTFELSVDQYAFKTEDTVYRGRKVPERILVPVKKPPTFKIVSNLTTDALIYMFEKEIPRYTKMYPLDGHAHNWINKHVTSGALKVNADTGIVDLESLLRLEPFNGEDDLFNKATDYAKLGLRNRILNIFKGAKSRATIEGMTPDKLDSLDKILHNTPFLLCLHKFCKVKYDLKPLRYPELSKLIQQQKTAVPSLRILPALRILNFIQTKLRKRLGHTIFAWKQTCDLYCRSSIDNVGDVPMLDQGLAWLCENGELAILQDGYICLRKDYETANAICSSLTRIYQNAHVAEMRPALRSFRTMGVPCKPNKLKERQHAAMCHVMNNWLTLVTGPPGTGKTAVIEACMVTFSNIAVGTFIGTMVSSLRGRFGGRAESAHTLHSIIHSVKQFKSNAYASAIECLVIDEGSNIDQMLMAKILPCFPRLSRLVIVMDPWQINPIGPGTPAKDFLELFPQHIFQLTENLRVAPCAVSLALAMNCILNGQVREIAWSKTLSLSKPVILLDNIDAVSLETVRPIVIHLYQEYESFVLHEDPRPFICAFQFCTLKRKVCAMLNKTIDEVLTSMGQLPVQREGQFFVNQKIRFTKTMSMKQQDAAPGKKRKRPQFAYVGVRNGELALIIEITRDTQLNRPVLGIVDPLVKLEEQEIHYVLLDAQKHVDPKEIDSAWCITVNASQGSQFPMMVAWFHYGFHTEPDKYSGDNIWKREHLYVGMSRSKFKTIVVAPGGEDALAVLVRECSKPRNTSVQREMRQNSLFQAQMAQYCVNLPVSGDVAFCVPKDDLQLMPKNVPCVPTFVSPLAASIVDEQDEEEDE